jgi:hypothetical protein
MQKRKRQKQSTYAILHTRGEKKLQKMLITILSRTKKISFVYEIEQTPQ